MIDPVTGWAIAKTAGEISKKLYEFGKSLKGREEKQQIDELLDKLTDLKHSASLLEDENRELRDHLRFKSADFEWQGYYWVEKIHSNRPLCPKCFAKQTIAHLGLEYDTVGGRFRLCTVCNEATEVGASSENRRGWEFEG